MSKYILFNDLERLREASYNEKKEKLIRLADQCDRYFNMYLPKTHPNGSTTYLGIAIVNLGLMYKITQDNRYLIQSIRFMETVCSYEVWGYAHLVNVDLSASWILFGLSLGYNWLENDLPSETKEMVFNKLRLQSKIMYDYKKNTEGHGWSTAYYQNHNWINLTGLACCGYALKGQFDLAEDYIKDAKENFEIVFDSLSDDGSNYEGVVYWRYGGMWLFVYADLLKSTEGIDYFKKSGYLKNTFWYRLSQSAADLKRQLNFGDCHDRYSGHTAAVYYKIAAEYNNSYAQYFGDLVSENFLYEEQYQSQVKPGILPEACFELLWYSPDVKTRSLDELPRVSYFEDLGLISIRTGYDCNATVFSFKCGAPGGKKQWTKGWKLKNEQNYDVLSLSHHHPDNLSFILNKGHSYFFIDDGYNRNILPANHNVLLVDDQLADVMDVNDVYMTSIQKRMDEDSNINPVEDYFGEIKYLHTNDFITFFKAENTKIYPKALEMDEVSRFVFTDNLEYIVIVDNLKSKKEHVYSAIFNSDKFPQKQTNGSYLYENLFEKLHYVCYSKNELNLKLLKQEVKSVMTTQEPDKVCTTILHTMSVNSSRVTEERMIHLFAFEEEKMPKMKDDVVVLGDNRYLLFQSTKDFVFDGEYLYVEFDKDKLSRFALVNGTKVLYKNQLVFERKTKTSIIKDMLEE